MTKALAVARVLYANRKAEIALVTALISIVTQIVSAVH